LDCGQAKLLSQRLHSICISGFSATAPAKGSSACEIFTPSGSIFLAPFRNAGAEKKKGFRE
jgi:hypothetical protein